MKEAKINNHSQILLDLLGLSFQFNDTTNEPAPWDMFCQFSEVLDSSARKFLAIAAGASG
jgi:hypothetical protein